MLILLQFVVTWLSLRSRSFRKLVRAEPTILFYQGQFLSDKLRAERVLEGDVLAAMRQHGVSTVEGVGAVVLEADGSFTVLREVGQPTALRDVGNPPPTLQRGSKGSGLADAALPSAPTAFPSSWLLRRSSWRRSRASSPRSWLSADGSLSGGLGPTCRWPMK